MKRVGLRIPFNLWEKLKDIAKYRGFTLNSLAIDILSRYAEEWREKNE